MTSHPTYHLHTPRIPHPLPRSPPRCSAGRGLSRLPAVPVQLVPGCISWLIARHVFLPPRHWFRPQSPAAPRHAHFTRGHVRNVSLPPLTCCRWRVALAKRKRDLPPNSCNDRRALPDELHRGVNSFCFFYSYIARSDSVNRKAMCSPLHHIDGERSETFIRRRGCPPGPGCGSLGICGGPPLFGVINRNRRHTKCPLGRKTMVPCT